MKCNPAVATIAIDLAKTVFQVLAVDVHGNVLESHRLSRSAFIAFWRNCAPVRVVMEACGSAHHFGRWLSSLGHQVTLLPAQYVRPYVRRSKTDAADCLAMIEAARAIDLKPVPIKTELQQTIQLLHRARQQWQETRTARINLARGLLREFGIVVPEGAERGRQAMRTALGHSRARVRSLRQRSARRLRASRSIDCAPGRLRSPSGAASTRLRSVSPTSWCASSGRRGTTRAVSMATTASDSIRRSR